MCVVLLPPGVNPIEVKYISYHIVYHHVIYHISYHIYIIMSCHIYHIIYQSTISLITDDIRVGTAIWTVLSRFLYCSVLGLITSKEGCG
jgi:hypothetical protein